MYKLIPALEDLPQYHQIYGVNLASVMRAAIGRLETALRVVRRQPQPPMMISGSSRSWGSTGITGGGGVNQYDRVGNDVNYIQQI